MDQPGKHFLYCAMEINKAIKIRVGIWMDRESDERTNKKNMSYWI